jgi:Asp-tRNA(Asn)/Glu-tRNA(Gln) amidotransferase A subunit family amidase
VTGSETTEPTSSEVTSALENLDLLGLAALIRDGEVAPEELLDDTLRRLDARNPAVNAVVTDLRDQARAAIEAGLPDGPFTGVPFLLKDLRAMYAGAPSTAGSRYWADKTPDHDSELVARHKRAGLVIFGKTNTPEFGCCPSTEGALFGATRNPWDSERSAGGSSGGSAAAVASRIVPAAHGSDGGGSIRIPASCCGVFGFKPTRGRNPAGPDYGEAWSGLSVEHALTLSVRDSAALLDATSGPAPGDPYWAPPPAGPFVSEVGRDPGTLRVAVQREPLSGAPVDEDCIAAVDEAAALLEDLGHELADDRPAYDTGRMGPAYPLLIAANVQAAIDEHAAATGREPEEGEIENVIRVLAGDAHTKTAADMVRAVWAMHATGRQVAPFFETYDVLLSPVVATPPPPLGTLDTTGDDVGAYLSAVFGFIPFTALSNIAGIPSMSVPLYWNDAGLPIGVHFVAGFGRDDVLFRLAGQLEEARPWAGRRPPVAGRS